MEKGGARLYNKNGRDWTTKYWPIALAVDLPCRAAILDGEVIVSGGRGAGSRDLERAEPAGVRRFRHPPSRRPQSYPLTLAAAQASAVATG
ncbi:hypothetical protein [Mesorhizobium sp.]|uniref:hypothetical protein n=1 Tax=Mesorhizobium sp. TaxID=1871066 RepID=UPI0025BF9EEA|nr:hypothetical protein [Mesorhizobium sp.]